MYRDNEKRKVAALSVFLDEKIADKFELETANNNTSMSDAIRVQIIKFLKERGINPKLPEESNGKRRLSFSLENSLAEEFREIVGRRSGKISKTLEKLMKKYLNEYEKK